MKKFITLLALTFCLNGKAQLVANFSATPTNGCYPVVVSFTDNSTGSPTSWSWDFGDGGTSAMQNPFCNYASPGVYSVTLTVSNGTFTNTVVKTNYITFNAPIASFVVSPVCLGAASFFNATTSLPATGAAYNWNFGGTSTVNTATLTSQTCNYTYTTAGTYSVSLTVNIGTCSSTFTSNAVVNPSPTASYTLVQDPAPHTWDVYPTYSSTVDSAKWYWGDGNYTAGLYPSHTYSVASTYTICVIVFEGSCTSSYCQNDSVYRLANNSPLSTMVYVNIKQDAAGIETYTDKEQVNIYPNPNNGSFVIEPNSATKQTMQVYDVTGKMVLSQSINGKTNIDAGSLNEGVYNISPQSNEGVVNKRLVIVR